MITLVCGEDNSASRLYFASEIANFKTKGFVAKQIASEDLKYFESGYEDYTLFGSRTFYINENIQKAYTRNRTKLNDLLSTLSKNKELQVLIWVDSVSKRDLGITASINVKEFRPDKNIFKLLESCYPTNLKNFVNTLNEIKTKNNEFFIFLMLSRHIKKLLLYQLGIKQSNIQQWQEFKIDQQQKNWKKEKLIDYYDKLIGIDSMIKLGKSPYGMFAYIETLSAYYL